MGSILNCLPCCWGGCVMTSSARQGAPPTWRLATAQRLAWCSKECDDCGTQQVLPIIASLIPNLHSTSIEIQLPVLKFLYLSILQLNMIGKQVCWGKVRGRVLLEIKYSIKLLPWYLPFYLYTCVLYVEHLHRSLHWLLLFGGLVKNCRNHVLQGLVVGQNSQKWNRSIKAQTFTYDYFLHSSFCRPFHKVVIQNGW